jgi:hypothetical protein
MKKISFILICFVFWGCEIVQFQSEPQLNLNGRWFISDITPIYETTMTNSIDIIESDYFAISPFIIQSTIGDKMIIQNDTTNIKPCFFYKIGYVWEFDNNILIIKNNYGVIKGMYYIWFGDQFYNPNDFKLQDKINGEHISGNWHLKQNGNGSNRSNDLIISVPEIWFNINGPIRSYERCINQKLLISFTR